MKLTTAVIFWGINTVMILARMVVFDKHRFSESRSETGVGDFLRGVTEGGGFHTPVRGTMFVRDGAVIWQ